MTYHDQDRGVTLEDLHGEVREEESCAANHCKAWGFHRHGCALRTYEDEREEFWAELTVDMSRGN